MLDAMFCLTDDVVSSLQTLLEDFGKEGLVDEPGENVPVTVHRLLVVAERLKERKELLSNASKRVLAGFALSSFDEFKAPFKLMLDVKAVEALDLPNVINADFQQKIYDEIVDICRKA